MAATALSWEHASCSAPDVAPQPTCESSCCMETHRRVQSPLSPRLQATQEYLDWVEREKQHQRATPGAAAAAGGEGTPDPTALENAALEKVMGILSQRAPQQLAEQPEPGEAVAAASDFLAGLQSTSTPTAQQEPPGCVVSCG